jgi:hypothetical protein
VGGALCASASLRPLRFLLSLISANRTIVHHHRLIRLHHALPSMEPRDWDDISASDLGRPQDTTEDPLPVPATFPAFPYPTPYAIQTDFMQNLFECIDRRKVGIFESPTGTGKSLSMICGAVSWLMEHERAEQEQMKQDQDEKTQGTTETSSGSNLSNNTSAKDQKDDMPDWVLQYHAVSSAVKEKQERETRRKELEARVQKIRDREKKMRENMDRKLKRQAASMNSIGGIGGARSMSGASKKVHHKLLDNSPRPLCFKLPLISDVNVLETTRSRRRNRRRRVFGR